MKNSVSFFLLFLFMFGFSCTGIKMNVPLLVGTFTKGSDEGLYLYDFNKKDGTLTQISKSDAGVSPAYFCFPEKRDLIYTINEVSNYGGAEKSGGLTTLRYDKTSGKIEKISEMAVPNGGPCYISISSGDDFLFMANYSGGSAVVIKLDEKGIPVRITDTIFYERSGDKVSHAHMISQDPQGKRIYLTDLGLDRIMIYDLDKSSGKLKPFISPAVNLPEGSGPRHFIFNDEGSKMYLINELNSTIMVLEVNDIEGLKILQTVNTVSEGFQGKNYCADIHIGKGGDFLYGSNRGENSIVTFRIGITGLIELAGHTPCGGDWPRNFVIDNSGKYLLVGNQRSDNISVFEIDSDTGLPQSCGDPIEVTAPACLKFP
jgi:6-phosphogluconolactonase